MVDAVYTPGVWSAFFSAEVSASAALTGLIFVAVSINLAKIIGHKWLVARAAKALLTLTGVLLASTLCLVPGQHLSSLGAELTILGGMLWIAATGSHRAASHDNPYITTRQKVLQSVLTQFSAIPFPAAGLSLLFSWGGGLHWLVMGTVFALIAALMDGWVLLIEVLR
jgi:modulator of FtsH protease